MKGSTSELIVGDERGAWVTRTVKRKPEEERWQRGSSKKIVGVPWRKNDEDEKADGEEMKTEVTIMDKEYRERVEEQGEDHRRVPRRAYLTKGDFEEYGFTMRCPGCISILKGTTRQAHSEHCRRRMETELEGHDKVKEAGKRKDEFVKRAIAKDTEEREAKHLKGDVITENKQNEKMDDHIKRDEGKVDKPGNLKRKGDDIDDSDRRGNTGGASSSGNGIVASRKWSLEEDEQLRHAETFLKKF